MLTYFTIDRHEDGWIVRRRSTGEQVSPVFPTAHDARTSLDVQGQRGAIALY